jgi:hypothetical protein
MLTPRSFLAVLAVVLTLAPSVRAAPVKVVPNRDWVAVIRDEKLKKEFPKAGVITDAKTFARVWKAWRSTEKVPEIDFKKEFVVVTLASGPNRPSIGATLDDGDLKIRAIQTLIGGPGFGYSLATFNRKGVKTVNGRKLP